MLCAKGEQCRRVREKETIMTFVEYEEMLFNLGYVIGFVEGYIMGLAEGMAEVGYSLQEIADALEISEAEVRAILPKTA